MFGPLFFCLRVVYFFMFLERPFVQIKQRGQRHSSVKHVLLYSETVSNVVCDILMLAIKGTCSFPESKCVSFVNFSG